MIKKNQDTGFTERKVDDLNQHVHKQELNQECSDCTHKYIFNL